MATKKTSKTPESALEAFRGKPAQKSDAVVTADADKLRAFITGDAKPTADAPAETA